MSAAPVPEASDRLRILLVIAGLPAGGAERQMALLARHLDRSAFDVGLVIFNAANKVHYSELLDGSVWFRALGLSRHDGVMLLPRLIRKLNAAVTEFGPDIVHTSLNVANHATRLTALLMRWRIPVITSVRVDFRSGYRRHEKILERLLWRRSAHIVTNAQRTREQLVADLGIPEDRVSVIANGVADEFFCRDPGPPPPWWPEGRVALTVGRYTPQKNHLGLVAAIASLKERSLIGDWRFVFLGEGPMGPDIRTAIDAAGLNDRIVMAAPETEMPPIYRAASLFILPSLFEGLPNALLEAAAARCPIAASPGANEAGVVTPGRGWLLGDPLADSLAVPLQAPGPALAAAADVASAHVRDRFSGATATARTAAIYRRLAANAGRRGRCGSR